MTDPILDEKERAAVHAQRDAAQAVEIVRKKQMVEAVQLATEQIPNKDEMAEVMREQFENVLAKGTEQEKSLILARVPYICQDIKNINARGERLEESMDKIQILLATYPLVSKLVFGFAGAILTGVVAVSGWAIFVVIQLANK